MSEISKVPINPIVLERKEHAPGVLRLEYKVVHWCCSKIDTEVVFRGDAATFNAEDLQSWINTLVIAYKKVELKFSKTYLMRFECQ